MLSETGGNLKQSEMHYCLMGDGRPCQAKSSLHASRVAHADNERHSTIRTCSPAALNYERQMCTASKTSFSRRRKINVTIHATGQRTRLKTVRDRCVNVLKIQRFSSPFSIF